MARTGSEMFIVGWVDYEENYKYDEQKELELNRDNFIKAIKGGACRNEKHPPTEGTKPLNSELLRVRGHGHPKYSSLVNAHTRW